MAKDVNKVDAFLNDLTQKLKPLAEKEIQKLLELKKAEKQSRNEDFDNQLHSWDFRYYNRLLLESEYKVNEEQIKEYFPLESCTKGMLELYERVLSLKITQVKDAQVWHPDVTLYEVKDSKTDSLIGCFYLDLHPRDGKYTHAACFGLQPGYELNSKGLLKSFLTHLRRKTVPCCCYGF
jgi:Zn-dependent oligopeptidase